MQHLSRSYLAFTSVAHLNSHLQSFSLLLADLSLHLFRTFAHLCVLIFLRVWCCLVTGNIAPPPLFLSIKPSIADIIRQSSHVMSKPVWFVPGDVLSLTFLNTSAFLKLVFLAYPYHLLQISIFRGPILLSSFS